MRAKPAQSPCPTIECRRGTWDLTLDPATVSSLKVPAGQDGLFGSGTLQQYSPIVIDFAKGELLLGPFHPTR